MGRLLLDTTVLIDALRGRPAADRLRLARRRGDEPWVCAVTVEEMCRGVHPDEEPSLRRLVRGLRCAPLGMREGERAGAWRRAFAAQGTTLHQADCLIAAAAVGVGSTLVTGNPKDFPMVELAIEHWPVGR